jgi:MFS family permease
MGIGGMLAAANAAVAEVANLRHRSFCVTLMAAGYPIGSLIGGTIAALLLTTHDWRMIFLFGAAITSLFIPLVTFWVPESIAFLVDRQPASALVKINRALGQVGHASLQVLPTVGNQRKIASYSTLLGKPLIVPTLLLTAAYFTHCLTFYFMLKWIPKIVADLGFPHTSSALVLVAASAGGAAGALSIGIASRRLSLTALTCTVLFASTLLVALFGSSGSSLARLEGTAAAAGFFTNAGVVGLYAVIARTFPVSVRASATGVVIGLGRTGSALAPILTGVVFQMGYGLPVVAPAMALGSLIAGICLLRLHTTHLAPLAREALIGDPR